MTPDSPAVRLRALRKEFPGTPPVVAVDDVDLDIVAGEFFSMLGPSGSGKTTVLRTLPIWIFNNLFRPNQAPVVNVVAVVLVVVSVLPVWLAQRLSGGEAAGSRL